MPPTANRPTILPIDHLFAIVNGNGANPKNSKAATNTKNATRSARIGGGVPLVNPTATTRGMRTARPVRSYDFVSFEAMAASARKTAKMPKMYGQPCEANTTQQTQMMPIAMSTSTSANGFPWG